jgi:hypothetical protein
LKKGENFVLKKKRPKNPKTKENQEKHREKMKKT